MKRIIPILMCLGAMAAFPVKAEIQWVTGGVPENAPVSGVAHGVPDSPEEAGNLTATQPGGNGVVLCHLTTCTKIVNNYPADCVNYFYLNQHQEIDYYAYFLMKPTTRIHTASVEWYNPTGNRIAKQDYEFRVGFTDRLLTIVGENYQWFLATSKLGMSKPNSEAKQDGLPRDMGLYTVHLIVDGQLSGVTFFYVREADKSVAPIATPMPNTGTSGQSAASAVLPPALLMSTPVSTAPLMRKKMGTENLVP